jgi:hypothetical protein
MSESLTRGERTTIQNQGRATAAALKRLETKDIAGQRKMRKLLPEAKIQLAHLIAQGRGIEKSCKALGFSSTAARAEMKRDAAFAALIDQARIAAKENLEESMYDRAVEKDTTAGIFLLKAMDPDRYGDKLKIDARHRFEINVNLIPAEEDEDATGDVLDAEYTEEGS